MDVQRSDVAARKRRKRILVGAITVLVVGAAFFFVSRLGPAAPRVERSTVWIDEVKRGPLIVKVRGIGTLVPENLRWLTAQTDGRVERIHILPGAPVDEDTVILELSNPELQQSLRNAELQLASSQAQLANQRGREEDTLLEMEYQLAQLRATFEKAKLEESVNEELFAEGLVAERDLKRSRLDAEQLEIQTEILSRRLDNRRVQVEQNLAPAIAAVHQDEERVSLYAQQVEELTVRAGTEGILQRLPLEEGQQVRSGEQLAQVADPTKLKATVRIPETQAKDILIGQPAEVDTRNGIIQGEVARINPTVSGGTVDVDIRLLSELPRGARPDLTVEGSIVLENLSDVVYVGRPAYGREHSTVGMFRLETDGTIANRTPVEFGRSSVSEIEVRRGLQPGDRVILSDTSQYDDNDRLRIVN